MADVLVIVEALKVEDLGGMGSDMFGEILGNYAGTSEPFLNALRAGFAPNLRT